MYITKLSLSYVFDIANYLYFNVELNQEIEINKLCKPETRDIFNSALEFIMSSGMTFLGGFRISYVDEKRNSIKKVPHHMLSKDSQPDEKNTIMPFKFEKSKRGKELVVSDKYLKLFEYGNA